MGSKRMGVYRVSLLRCLGLVGLCGMMTAASGQSAPAADPAAQAPPSPTAPATQDSRDLKPIQTKQSAAVSIPRSYALVVGISAYKNLPKSAQLEFPNRDAEDIYAALISP